MHTKVTNFNFIESNYMERRSKKRGREGEKGRKGKGQKRRERREGDRVGKMERKRVEGRERKRGRGGERIGREEGIWADVTTKNTTMLNRSATTKII